MVDAALVVQERHGLARTYLPRVAWTGVTGTPGSTSRSTAVTISPPWFASAISASAPQRR